MSSLTDADQAIMAVIERCCSAMSLLGSVIILTTFTSSVAFRQRAINRLILYATFGNVLSNVAILITRARLQDPDSFVCQFQAFLVQVFMQSDAYWALAMALNVYLTFYRHYNSKMLRRMEMPYFIVCYTLSFVPGFIYLFINSAEDGRPYGDATLWCWIKPDWVALRFATFYGPIWVVILSTLFIYARTGREIYRRRKTVMNLCPPDTSKISDYHTNTFVHHVDFFTNPARYSGMTSPTAMPANTTADPEEDGGYFTFKATKVVVPTDTVNDEWSSETTAGLASTYTPVSPTTVPWKRSSIHEVLAHANTPSYPARRTSLAAPAAHPPLTANNRRSSAYGAPAPLARRSSHRRTHSYASSHTIVPIQSEGTQAAAKAMPTPTINSSRRNTITILPPAALPLPASSADASARRSSRGQRSSIFRSRSARPSDASTTATSRAAWLYSKCALLFFVALLVTWIPSSGNRVYGLMHPGAVSRPLCFASAFVLPLQGFWNACIYCSTNSVACVEVLWDWIAWVGKHVGCGTRAHTRGGGRRDDEDGEGVDEEAQIGPVREARISSAYGNAMLLADASRHAHLGLNLKREEDFEPKTLAGLSGLSAV